MSLWERFKKHLQAHPALGPVYGGVIAATVGATATVTTFILGRLSPGRSLPAEYSGTVPPPQNKIMKPELTLKEPPGWEVQLRTASFSAGEIALDPGVIGHYTEPGPVFAQGTLVKEFMGSSKGLQQNIAASASAKFVARTAGTYQLGTKIEAPSDNVTCYGTLSLDGAVLAKVATNGTRVKTEPKQLSAGRHDANFVFGCEGSYIDWIIRKPAPAIAGQATILVMHPNDAGPMAAGPGDFVHIVQEPRDAK